MQFSFQLEVHIGAHTLLCALRLLDFLKLALRVLLTKVKYSPPEAGGSSGVQPLCSCTRSIINQFDLRQGFQPKPWIPVVYMFKPTKRCYCNVVLLIMLPETTYFAKALYICYITPSKKIPYMQTHLKKRKVLHVSDYLNSYYCCMDLFFIFYHAHYFLEHAGLLNDVHVL